jgi:predicted dehydrogenase
MEKIRLAVAGMGHRGLGLTKGHQKLKTCKLTAICDSIKPVVEKAHKELGDPDIEQYTDFKEMLESKDIDAVAVYTFPTTQIDLVVEALEAGKHACCEVPLTYSIEDCWKLIMAVEKSGLKFQLQEQTRYWPFIQAWKRMVDEGLLGKIVFAEGQYIGFYDFIYNFWKPETGEFPGFEYARKNPEKVEKTWREEMQHPIYYLPHELSPLLYIFDDRVVKVSAMGTRKKSYAAPDTGRADIEVALMHTEKDTVMRLAAGFNIPRGVPHHWYHLLGTKGTVETKRSDLDEDMMWFSDTYMEAPAKTTWGWKHSHVPREAVESGHSGADYYPMANFIKSIVEDTTPPLDVYKAVETAAPAILAAKSIDEKNRCFDVPDFRPGPSRKPGQAPSSV